MSTDLFDGSSRKRSAAVHDANKQAQAGAERAQREADLHNGALMRSDPMLTRLLKAYSICDADNRAALVRLAEVACTAPGGIV